MPLNAGRVCEWLTEAGAFAEFARASGTIIQALDKGSIHREASLAESG
jgi:hypothetical protein